MANTTEKLEVVREVQIDFWHTTGGLLLKRIAFLMASTLVAAVISEILNNGHAFGPMTPIVYVVLTTIRDILDPKLPNTANAVQVK